MPAAGEPLSRRSLGSGKAPATNAMPIDHRDRMIEVQFGGASKDPVEQFKHPLVRVASSTEQDEPRTVVSAQRQKARIVEIGSDHDPSFASGCVKHRGVGC